MATKAKFKKGDMVFSVESPFKKAPVLGYKIFAGTHYYTVQLEDEQGKKYESAFMSEGLLSRRQVVKSPKFKSGDKVLSFRNPKNALKITDAYVSSLKDIPHKYRLEGIDLWIEEPKLKKSRK